VAFNENTRVKIPALIHLERLGYKYLSLKTSTWDPDTNIFTNILDKSLSRLNPEATPEELEIFKKKSMASLDNDDLGKVFYTNLISQNGLKLIDFENFENNTFNCVTELEFEKGLDAFRPDITLLINGLPLVFIEVKKPNNKEGIIAERNRINARLANKNFKKIINLTQFMIFSNNMEYDTENLTPIQGAFYATTSHKKASFNCFREEALDFTDKKMLLGNEDEDFILADTNLLAIKHSAEFGTNKNPETPTNKILSSMLSKNRLAFILQYGITYAQTFNGIEKHIMRYPQVFASLAMKEKISAGQKKGIIWHTQGSGKTALAFYNTRFLSDYFQEQGKIAKFYFIVDRLDLLTQAKSEFTARGLKVNTVSTKSEFLNDFTKNQAISNQTGELEITVVNIQKFSEDASEHFNNNYDLNIQRIYFIDEAHRSYKTDGSFLANLMTSDRDAILICLTGTPIIGEFASKKIFGDYFHKYYYNASISDGYTLRLIREEIETSYKSSLSDVLAQFEIQKGELDKSTVLAHKNFVAPMLDYILVDLQRSRMLHNDQTIGGMVVCDSSDQAREMQLQFEERFSTSQEMTSAIILFDAGTKDDRKGSVEEFKEGRIDILFVYNMLLTGFDAPRLKKLYMGRVVRDHNLLQALTRVNRPYKDFKFGYIVDFADIRKEFELTNAAYFAELKDELGEEFENYSNLFITREEVEEAVIKIRSDLFIYDLENAEEFSRQISNIQDKQTMRSIIASLENSRNLHNLIRLMNFEDLMRVLDFKKINLLLTEATNHLNLLNLKDKVENADETKLLLNSALEDVVFMFRKDGEEELRMGEMKGRIRQVREALERNIDEKDPEFLLLIEELRRILNKGNISENVVSDIDGDLVDLESLLQRAKELNHRNALLAAKYGGDPKYARIHKAIKSETDQLSDLQIFDLLDKLRNVLNEIVQHNSNILNNRSYFEATIERTLAIIFDESMLYEKFLDMITLKQSVASEYFREYEGAVA
jgi:type I restriction enzyme R subunit